MTTDTATAAGAELQLTADNGLARITLNRPRAINALNQPMIAGIVDSLEAWRNDDSVAAVLIDGAGERGLCAGGDIRVIYEDVKSGGNESRWFWRDEYAMNVAISEYPKPYIALMDGLVMGGGVGVSAHGSIRIVTERSKVGMPETGIGFAPDVGGTYLLSRAPGQLGTHLALSGLTAGPADAIACGLADTFVSSERLADLRAALAANPGQAAAIVADFASEPGPTPFLDAQEWIDECYGSDSVEQIVERLGSHPDAEARNTAEILLTKAPTSLKVTLASLRAARSMTLREVIEQEYRVSVALTERPDLVEGVRAQIIDKDRNPQWSPAFLPEVTSADVDAILNTDTAEGVFG
ncbi:enoyl-CoA hydratase/isomerase family protein [Saxibacter everestensis]|uniref:3-hydroxyisobutyryl-CoA hydrolase n=1 Tax=Saxibacter everestensis TaxID=2909229 RepID=A0ABY8QPC4_9MICO|nr:enoyl-CoA hydratase/isomerase family protein [Brevibacteriaceae bacterium ZFBP1038]